MPVTVYIADPRYNYSGVLSSDSMPLNVGYIKAYMSQRLPEVQASLFAYPDKLVEAIRREPPDVLMVSNYCWNEDLSLALGRIAKKVRPDTLVVMGGPNIPIEAERQIAFFAERQELDAYILGEGDIIATELMEHYLEAGMDKKKFGAREILSCLYRGPDGEVRRTETRPRKKEIDEIPSPYLLGFMDEFFDGKLAPMIETNRGCPFTCTFCCQGTSWYTKVHYFSKERLKEEIMHIGGLIQKYSPHMGTLRIADSNYGMFERDTEISSYIGEAQKLYKWPTYIDATTGKNRADRIIKSLEQVNGALVLYQAVQSLDENVLRNVKRSTISLEAYEQLRVAITGRGLRSNSDLILCLPGETRETYLNAIFKLLDSGMSQVTNFQLIMLKGSELETLESREKFKFDARFRIGPKNFGVYDGEPVFDIEEVVVATDTLSFDDYLYLRKVALACAAFWHDNYLEESIAFAQRMGLKRSEWLMAVVDAMDQADGDVKKYVEDFLNETRNELFPTREACREYYSRPEISEKLVHSEIGDNLMHKYRAVASFHIWPAICRCAMDATRRALEKRGLTERVPDFDAFWADFHRYIELRHAHGYQKNEILASSREKLHYDIKGWLDAGMPLDPAPFRWEKPREVVFRLSDDGRDELERMLQVWTHELKGLTKAVTRVRVAAQVRECQVAGSAYAAAGD